MFKNKDSMFSNNSSKYGNLLTVILIVSIVAIVGIIIFIGVRIYNKYHVEKGAAAAVSQFENIVSSTKCFKYVYENNPLYLLFRRT